MKTLNSLLLISALLVLPGLTPAAVPDKSPDDMKEEADAVFVGEILVVHARASTKKAFGGESTTFNFISNIKIESVEKGEGLKPGVELQVDTWKHEWKGPLLPPPGNRGHFHNPE